MHPTGRRVAAPERPLHACMTTSMRSLCTDSTGGAPQGIRRRRQQTDRIPDRPAVCTRRPCPRDRPRGLPVRLMKAGRSSDSQAQPTACLLASRTEIPCGSQWPDNSRPLFPTWKVAWIQRRGRPGIAPEFPVCPSIAAANGRPPDSMAESIGRDTLVKL